MQCCADVSHYHSSSAEHPCNEPPLGVPRGFVCRRHRVSDDFHGGDAHREAMSGETNADASVLLRPVDGRSDGGR